MLANISQQIVGDVLIVGPAGKLDGNGARDLETALQASLEGGATQILFDFSELAYISSSGLRVILVTAKQLKKKSGAIALCQLNDDIRQIFDMSGFSSILNIESSREAALSAFF